MEDKVTAIVKDLKANKFSTSLTLWNAKPDDEGAQ